MTDKPKFPYADAMKVAESLKAVLAHCCERIQICGSLRRRKNTVGDIEILYVSNVGRRAVDLLSNEEYSLADTFIDSLLAIGALRKRPNINGGFSWGAKNKLA